MWLTGYWMEHGGFRPEEIQSLSPGERTVWQVMAELNREQRKEDIRAAVEEGITNVLRALAEK